MKLKIISGEFDPSHDIVAGAILEAEVFTAPDGTKDVVVIGPHGRRVIVASTAVECGVQVELAYNPIEKERDMETQIRPDDPQYAREQRQRLAIAAGMTLSDGSPIVVGGPKCPSIPKIKKAIGFDEQRMTRDQFSDARDDCGAVRPYFEPRHEGGPEVARLLAEWSGLTDCDGEMSLSTFLQIS